MNKLVNINKEELLELIDNLYLILSYPECQMDRPIDICDKLFNKYKMKYSGTLYHGFSNNNCEINDIQSILKSYQGWVSCSSEFTVAFDFAQMRLTNNSGFIIKVELNDIDVLNVSSLIIDCFRQAPDSSLAFELYDSYAAEHEYLISNTDMLSHISSIEIIDTTDNLKDEKFDKYF